MSGKIYGGELNANACMARIAYTNCRRCSQTREHTATAHAWSMAGNEHHSSTLQEVTHRHTLRDSTGEIGYMSHGSTDK